MKVTADTEEEALRKERREGYATFASSFFEDPDAQPPTLWQTWFQDPWRKLWYSSSTGNSNSVNETPLKEIVVAQEQTPLLTEKQTNTYGTQREELTITEVLPNTAQDITLSSEVQPPLLSHTLDPDPEHSTVVWQTLSTSEKFGAVITQGMNGKYYFQVVAPLGARLPDFWTDLVWRTIEASLFGSPAVVAVQVALALAIAGSSRRAWELSGGEGLMTEEERKRYASELFFAGLAPCSQSVTWTIGSNIAESLPTRLHSSLMGSIGAGIGHSAGGAIVDAVILIYKQPSQLETYSGMLAIFKRVLANFVGGGFAWRAVHHVIDEAAVTARLTEMLAAIYLAGISPYAARLFTGIVVAGMAWGGSTAVDVLLNTLQLMLRDSLKATGLIPQETLPEKKIDLDDSIQVLAKAEEECLKILATDLAKAQEELKKVMIVWKEEEREKIRAEEKEKLVQEKPLSNGSSEGVSTNTSLLSDDYRKTNGAELSLRKRKSAGKKNSNNDENEGLARLVDLFGQKQQQIQNKIKVKTGQLKEQIITHRKMTK